LGIKCGTDNFCDWRTHTDIHGTSIVSPPENQSFGPFCNSGYAFATAGVISASVFLTETKEYFHPYSVQ
jgi:hypothetical protein